MVLADSNFQDYGNDCMIYKTVTLIQTGSKYTVIIAKSYEGMNGSDDVDIQSMSTVNEDEAKAYFNQHNSK